MKKFEEVGLNSFQITLDGNKKQHDKIRFTSKKEGSFDQIIKNINLLAQMKKVDIAVKVLFIVALAVIYFFWKCEYDPLVTILGILILVGASVLTYMQFHKLDELTDTMSSGEMKS